MSKVEKDSTTVKVEKTVRNNMLKKVRDSDRFPYLDTYNKVIRKALEEFIEKHDIE